jgi:riboflavin synthase
LFSGLVEALGTVVRVTASEGDAILTLDAPFGDLSLGESMCVSGVCLTVARIGEGSFDADVSAETLRRSTLGRLRPGDVVNLERSLRLGDRLGGHLVFGHVDAVGKLVSIIPEGTAGLYRFEVPPEVSRYTVEKGSVAVDGISLTVFDCDGRGFTVAVIPHTARVTTLGRLAPGAAVNIESDMIARYVEKLLSSGR